MASPDELIASIDTIDEYLGEPDDVLGGLLDAIAIFSGTVVSVEYCDCGDPEVALDDIELIVERDEGDNNPSYNRIKALVYRFADYVEAGDRVVAVVDYEPHANLIFGADGALVHPVPRSTKDVLAEIVNREAPQTVLDGIIGVWRLYNREPYGPNPFDEARDYLSGAEASTPLIFGLPTEADDVLARRLTDRYGFTWMPVTITVEPPSEQGFESPAGFELRVNGQVYLGSVGLDDAEGQVVRGVIPADQTVEVVAYFREQILSDVIGINQEPVLITEFADIPPGSNIVITINGTDADARLE